MLSRLCSAIAVTAALLLAGSARADLSESLKQGTPDLKSIGPLGFGPDGVLFVGDPQGAAIFAIDTGDRTPSPAGPFKVPNVNEKIAATLGTEANDILINDLAVNPGTGNAFLSVSRGKGPSALPALVKVTNKGSVEAMKLNDVKFAKAMLNNLATGERQKQDAITHLAYVKGTVYVAGLSNEQFSSTLRAIPFPFSDKATATGIEIFHGAHGRLETNSPIRTFVPFEIKGETNILAAYTCTPLVRIPVAELKAGQRIKGTTIAELGNMNRPLDMIVYNKDGKDYILMANSARGVMKVSTEKAESVEPITKHIPGGGKAGLTYETIANLKGVMQLDLLDKEHALLLVKAEGGALNLESIALP
jgi:DNA gyrase/topoisomerase IV subunit A